MTEDVEFESVRVKVALEDLDAAISAFKVAVEEGATRVRFESIYDLNDPSLLKEVELAFSAAPGSNVASLVKKPPFLSDE